MANVPKPNRTIATGKRLFANDATVSNMTMGNGVLLMNGRHRKWNKWGNIDYPNARGNDIANVPIVRTQRRNSIRPMARFYPSCVLGLSPMNTYPSHIPVEQLQHDARHVPLETLTGGFIHGYKQGSLITRAGLAAGNVGYIDRNVLGKYPALHAAVLNMASQLDGVVFQCWLGVLAPQSGDLETHTDGELPGNPIRYHLPVKTNQQAKYWDERVGTIHMIGGVWYGPIRYTQSHRVFNNGLSERWHLVTDFLVGDATQLPLGKGV